MFQMDWNSQHFFWHPCFLCALESMTFLRRLFKQLMLFPDQQSTTPKTPVTQQLWMSCWKHRRCKTSLGLVRFGDERWSGNWKKTTSHENKTPIRCVYIYIYICLHRSFKPSPQTKMFVTCLLINSCHLGPFWSLRYYVNMKMAEVRGSSWGSLESQPLSFSGILGIPNHRAPNH